MLPVTPPNTPSPALVRALLDPQFNDGSVKDKLFRAHIRAVAETLREHAECIGTNEKVDGREVERLLIRYADRLEGKEDAK
jgi:hypothetical protein